MWTKFGRDTLRGDWRQLHTWMLQISPRNSAIISDRLNSPPRGDELKRFFCDGFAQDTREVR
jgi:hypothetical protein